MAPVKSDLSFDDVLRAGLRVPLRDRKPKAPAARAGVQESAPKYGEKKRKRKGARS